VSAVKGTMSPQIVVGEEVYPRLIPSMLKTAELRVHGVTPKGNFLIQLFRRIRSVKRLSGMKQGTRKGLIER
jgi:hypothetical protein